MQALTLTPSSSMNETNCELLFMKPQAIDTGLALSQHSKYCQCLEDLGFEVTRLPAIAELPDSVFIEDPVVLLDEVAVLTLPFSPSRKGEVPNIEKFISGLGKTERIIPPGTMEGGDVLKIGRTLYVGISNQTNQEGFNQFRSFVEPFGYKVIPVKVQGALHLKTAATALDDRTLLMNPDWIDAQPFRDFRIVEVPRDEPFGGNIIAVGRRVLMHEGFVQTCHTVKSLGFEVSLVNISEFLKAEAGLTCMSVLYGEASKNSI